MTSGEGKKADTKKEQTDISRANGVDEALNPLAVGGIPKGGMQE